MGWTKRWRRRLRLLAQKDAVESELDEQLDLHLQLETEKHIAAGMAPEEARRQAVLAFGGIEKHKEEVRDARSLGWTSGLLLDLKLAWRILLKSPGLTLIAVGGMATGIAISASVFSLLGSALSRSLPVDEGDRIVALTNVDVETSVDALETHLHDLSVWREELTTVEELGAYRLATRNLLGEDPAEPLRVAEMTASGFRVTRTAPHLGRYLVDEDEEPGAPPVVVIGYDVWRERFGASEDIVGRTLRMSGETHTVVGVMPDAFGFPITTISESRCASTRLLSRRGRRREFGFSAALSQAQRFSRRRRRSRRSAAACPKRTRRRARAYARPSPAIRMRLSTNHR